MTDLLDFTEAPDVGGGADALDFTEAPDVGASSTIPIPREKPSIGIPMDGPAPAETKKPRIDQYTSAPVQIDGKWYAKKKKSGVVFSIDLDTGEPSVPVGSSAVPRLASLRSIVRTPVSRARTLTERMPPVLPAGFWRSVLTSWRPSATVRLMS